MGHVNVCQTAWNTSCTFFHFLSCDCYMTTQSRVHQCKDGGRRKGAWSEIKALKQELRKREEVCLPTTTELHVLSVYMWNAYISPGLEEIHTEWPMMSLGLALLCIYVCMYIGGYVWNAELSTLNDPWCSLGLALCLPMYICIHCNSGLCVDQSVTLMLSPVIFQHVSMLVCLSFANWLSICL